MKTLPKSLHTVTVLVNLARHLGSVDAALTVLGYGEGTAEDPHQLAVAALKQMEKKP